MAYIVYASYWWLKNKNETWKNLECFLRETLKQLRIIIYSIDLLPRKASHELHTCHYSLECLSYVCGVEVCLQQIPLLHVQINKGQSILPMKLLRSTKYLLVDKLLIKNCDWCLPVDTITNCKIGISGIQYTVLSLLKPITG